MSHLVGDTFGGSGIGALLGGLAGSIVPGVGTAIGASLGGALGGATGSALGGGNLKNDLLGGLSGAALGYGGAELAGAAGIGTAGAGAADAAAGGASADVASGVTSSLAAGGDVATGAGSASDLAAGVAGGTGADAATNAATLAGQGLQVAGPTAASVAPTGFVDNTTGLLTTDQAAGGTVGANAATLGPNAAPVAQTGFGTSGALGGGAPSGALTDPVTGQAIGAGPVATPTALPAAAPPGPLQGAWNSVSGFLNSPTGTAAGKIAGTAASGLGLLRSFEAQSNPANSIPGLSQLTSTAQQAATQGATLQSYLNNGTLPPAVQTAVSAATQDGIAKIKGNYASRGIAPGSTAETQDIAKLQQNAVVQGATLADQLLQQGLSQTNLSSEIYKSLVGINTGLNNQTNEAIGNLAQALAGGGTRVTNNANNTGAAPATV